MHLHLLAVAAAAGAVPVLANVSDDIREEFAKGLQDEISREQIAQQQAHMRAVARNSNVRARYVDDLTDGDGNDSQSKIFGIGDPQEYHPYKVDCPDMTWVRAASNNLSEGESAYMQKRSPLVKTANEQMLAASGMAAPPRAPVFGIALSGGGYRAMINGLGMTMALMNQSDEASKAGTGGWLDATSYMAGLSGGSWATGSFMANNGMLPTDLINNVWNLQSSLIVPDNDKVAFYTNMLQNVKDKANEGFPTQITDYWALALGEHLLPSQYHMSNGANYTFSNFAKNTSNFIDAKLPFPIVIAAEREPDEIVIAENATVWEFTPYEFGSWAIGFGNLSRGYFTPTEYMGTAVVNGKPNGTCYKGFDQLTYVVGTSSTLFNQGLLQLNASEGDSAVKDIIETILESVAGQSNDVSQIPNPAWKYDHEANFSNPLKDYQYLTLIDAGETNQNIPFEPLLMPPRNLDTIVAFDNSADTTYSWPNGSAVWTTYQRALSLATMYRIPQAPFPKVPSTAGFVNGGLNQRPVFFGCNDTHVPLVVYIPHYPWTAYSNSSTFDLAYGNDKASSQMLNSMRSVTLNGTVPTWPKCFACAINDKAYGYTSQNRSDECAQCFSTWCWNGIDNTTEPSYNYTPVAGITPEWLSANNLSSDVRTTPIETQSKSSADQLGAVTGAIAAGALLSMVFML